MKVIVLHSGGLDSTTCLLLANEKAHNILSLGIDYGQRSRIELDYAERQCNNLNIPRKVLKIEWDKPERQIPFDRSIEEIRQEISSAFLPGRNAIFLTLACAEAMSIAAEEVWIGINCIDYSGYPDCRRDFLDTFKKMINIAIPSGPKIVAPLMNLTKPEIAIEANRLGLRQDHTWSCYRPKETKNGIKPCGRCDACILNKYAWEQIE